MNSTSAPLPFSEAGSGEGLGSKTPLKGNPIHTLRGFGKFINNEPKCDWRGLPWVTKDAFVTFLAPFQSYFKVQGWKPNIKIKDAPSLSPLGNYKGSRISAQEVGVKTEKWNISCHISKQRMSQLSVIAATVES